VSNIQLSLMEPGRPRPVSTWRCAYSNCAALCGLRFHILGIFAEARFAVAPRAVMERLLRSSNLRAVAFPCFKHRSLQGAPIGKAQLPRQVRDTIHRVEMFRRLLIGLAA